MPRGRKKTFEQKLIEKLVACPHPSAPKSEREAFWGREMKILKSVFKEFPDKEFWEKVTFEKYYKNKMPLKRPSNNLKSALSTNLVRLSRQDCFPY